MIGEKKDDGMLEHKGMAWRRGMLLLILLIKEEEERRRDIFHGLGSILPYPQKTNDSSIPSVLPVF